MTLVVDASAVVVALVDEGPDGEWARATMERETLAAPAHLHVEVSSALRRAVLGGRIVWALHPTVTAYDAAYVALAEGLDVPLVTLDRRLARADGPACSFLLPPV
jgi:predicted nucleic acid-binding protein